MDLDVDIGSFLKGLTKRGQSGDGAGAGAGAQSSPYLKQLVAGILIALLIGTYLYFFYLPEQKRINEMQAMIDSTDQIRAEILLLDQEILQNQAKLSEGNARFDELNRLFHNKQELEDLYRNISLLALTYELLVAKLEKGGEVPVFSDKPPISQGEGLPSKKEVAFYKISVQFEFVGDYLGYTNFRRDLAQQKKIINIEREKITVRTGEDEGDGGIVDIATTLSTYRFPASDADRFITDG
ncbi:hypothetical protein N9444_06480 [Gammaproteobacteria bacterium]|jgi:Tfp pilus assembly protein PilO|nr:hypothetical protein [Gammaproteobacteria bacterium]